MLRLRAEVQGLKEFGLTIRGEDQDPVASEEVWKSPLM